MEIGQFATITKQYSPEDLAPFCELLGASDEQMTAVPEPLIGALFSYLLGVELPGPGTNWLKQEFNFLNPAPLCEPLTAKVEITRLRPEKHLVDLMATCTTADGTVICQGRSLMLAKDTGK